LSILLKRSLSAGLGYLGMLSGRYNFFLSFFDTKLLMREHNVSHERLIGRAGKCFVLRMWLGDERTSWR